MNGNDGRFNQGSDTPLLTSDEDANDFQLVAEILPDNSEIEARKRREAEEKAKKNTPDLFRKTKNCTPRSFFRRFWDFDIPEWILDEYETMRDFYVALMDGEEVLDSAFWEIWVATRKGVFPKKTLSRFAVQCARNVQRHMKDRRSIAALDVADRFLRGEATRKELNAAKTAAWEAAKEGGNADGAVENALSCCLSACFAEDAAECAKDAVYFAVRDASGSEKTAEKAKDAEERKQFNQLCYFGNPFGEKNGREN